MQPLLSWTRQGWLNQNSLARHSGSLGHVSSLEPAIISVEQLRIKKVDVLGEHGKSRYRMRKVLWAKKKAWLGQRHSQILNATTIILLNQYKLIEKEDCGYNSMKSVINTRSHDFKASEV